MSAGARLLLIGCWTLADDAGLLRWDAAWLRELLYLTDDDVNEERVSAWMAELATTGAVVPYLGPRGDTFAYITGFEVDHPTSRPSASRLPLPPTAVRPLRLAGSGAPELTDAPAPMQWSPVASTDRSEDVVAPHGDTPTPGPLAAAAGTGEAADDASAPSTGGLTEGPAGPQEGPEAGSRDFGRPACAEHPEHAQTTPEGSEQGPEEGAELTEQSSADLTTTSGSRAVPGSRSSTLLNSRRSAVSDSPRTHGVLTESGVAVVNVPLTCAFVETSATHPALREDSLSAHGVLLRPSRMEREREREREVEKEPLRASRARRASGDDASEGSGTTTSPSSSAYGAAKRGTGDPLKSGSGTSPAGVTEPALATPPAASSEPLAPTAAEPSVQVAAPGVVASDLSGADGVVDPDTTTHEDGDSMAMIDDSQESLFDVPDTMVKDPEPAKKKRKDPATWTPDRKEQAHALLKPWWEAHGNGWPQGYGVVFGVLVAALANHVAAEDITRALNELAQTRKPISGGTIAFALSKTEKQAAADRAYADAAASRSAEKYATEWTW